MGGSSAAGRPQPPLRRRRRAPRAAAALALLLLPQGCTAAVRRVREWDELRVSDVVPSKISTLPLRSKAQSTGAGLARMFQFGKDWLRIDGAADQNNFVSSRFKFERLDYPHEWAAKVVNRGGVRLRVGSQCRCDLAGVATYTKSDQTAWLRLQFEDCFGCESTATRAAVIMPLEPDATADSNLYQWMCSLSDFAACHAPPPTLTSTTSTTQAPTTSTTTHNPACNFVGNVGVKTHEVHLGFGKCLTEEKAGTHVVHKKTSAQGCQIQCELTYTAAAAGYADLQDINDHVYEINWKPGICKGYAYNSKTGECAIYTGATFSSSDNDEDWRCFGNVHAEKGSFQYFTDFTNECTSPPPTTTATTTITSTSTTTTTTTLQVELLSLQDVFGVRAEEGKVYGSPGEVHFSRTGVEATLLQLQSHCYWDVDYYLVGAALPVSEATWGRLLHLIGEYGEAGAWPAPPTHDCAASVTVDRLPIDADLVSHHGDATCGEATFTLQRLLLPLLLGLLAAAAMLWIRDRLFPDGIEPTTQMNSMQLAGAVLTAVIAALAALTLVYWVGQFVAWFFGRLAVKKLALGGHADLFCSAPALSDVCLPAAITLGSATLVSWLWPRDEKPPADLQFRTHELHLSYDPLTSELSTMVS